MASAQKTPAPRALWPIDKLAIANSIIVICLLGTASRRDSRALFFALGHIAIVGLIFALARYRSPITIFVRHWYLLMYLPFCYKEVPCLVSALGLHVADSTLADWDVMIWKIDPVFWLGDVQSRVLLEFLQIIYAMFIPGVVGLAIVLWLRKSRQEFRYGTFLIAVTFLVSFLGYLVLPARGPRFMPYAAQHLPLHGLWTFSFFQRSLDALEGVQYDCFPSDHVAVMLVGCHVAHKVSRPVFYIFVTFAALMSLSTVYLRYHYVIDVIAGVALAILLIEVAPRIYGRLNSENAA